jgi:hypothetical protein
MDELGVGRQVQKLDRLRKQQQRRCRKQYRVRQGDNGTNRASLVGLLIRIVIGRWLLLLSRLRRAGLHRRRGLSGNPVEMSEREHKLQRQRKQREPRAAFDVRPEPLHAAMRLDRSARNPLRPFTV